ncbi:MAG: nucleotidyltransferase family protein [Ignavibacterium sp.]|jgi:NDP-sugar pyrophosphorylase family protein|nr:nucleotidyltransferase family protein [Ignavibacterium sp.]
MQAMILAAGLGTRLKPITEDIPKALVELNGKTLLEIAIRKLIENDFRRIIINVHHFADKVKEFINNNTFAADIFISDESDLLCDTGGGIKKARGFFDYSPILVHNVDIISDLDLKEFYQYHLSDDAMASLVVSERKSSRYLLFNDEDILCGWQDVKKDEKIIIRNESKLHQLAFSGIHILNPHLIEAFPNEKVFSIIKAYLNIAATEDIHAYVCNEMKWIDVGKLDSLEKAELLVKSLKV